MWYRYFIGPALPNEKPASATLLVTDTSVSVDDYASQYIAGGKVLATRDEERQGARGRSFSFLSADGSSRHSLLLVKEGLRLYGLHAQGDPSAFGRSEKTLTEASRSLCLEKTEDYTAFKDARFKVAILVPRSWRETQRFSGGKTLLVQFTSPALMADADGQTAHASLSLTVEAIDEDGTLETYYGESREKLGAFSTISHKAWRDGYADFLSAETPLAVSRVKRFYRAAQGRGYGLAFEAREDAFPRVSRWCDLIASTLAVGDETKP